MKSSYFLPILFLPFTISLYGQQSLTLNDAISTALKNNFDITIARNEADIDKANNTKGNAGMLPSVNLNGNGGYNLNNVHQKQSAGTVNNYNPQSTYVIGANAELSWTLYDGGKMFVTKKKLEQIEALGELQFRAKVLDVTYNVIAAYYDIVRQKQTLKSFNEAINYNKQRVLITQTGFNAGTLDKTQLLQAQIDLNVAKENAINQKYAISAAQKALNYLLGKDPSSIYDTADTITQSAIPDKASLMQKYETSNADIVALKKQMDVANLSLKEAQKGYMPTVNVTGGYYYSQTHNSAGATLFNRTNGLQFGGTLTIPLFNGGEKKRKENVAKIELQSAQISLDNTILQGKTELDNAYTDYENQRDLLLIEKENNTLAKENLEISLQRLQQGQTTSLEVHQAQENYVQSSTRLINFEYNLKMRETKLKQMISEL